MYEFGSLSWSCSESGARSPAVRLLLLREERKCVDSSSDKECWIGCDVFWRWWHYLCADLAGMPGPTLGENA